MKTDRGSFRMLQHNQLLHLARRIGDALQHAYKGGLEYRYNKEDNLLRVTWCR